MDSSCSLNDVLGPNGQIARLHPNYEYRPAQIEMAQAVAEAIENRHHLCVEAGTGTGKTLAYLLPSIFCGKRVMVSTGTKNLQEQIFFKDIPFLERALGRKLSVCYLKGRSNYLCRKKLGEIENEGRLFSKYDLEHLKVIRAWSQKTVTGDRAELRNLPDDFILWHHLDARRETCAGQKCPNFETCFVTLMRQQALESDIVIVNHHLFFADLALRQGDFGSVLPDYSVVVFDEAHEIEDVATQYFGVTVSSYRIDELVGDAIRALSEQDAGSSFLEEQIARLSVSAGELFGAFRGAEGRFSFRELGSGLQARRAPQQADLPAEPYRKAISELTVIEGGLKALPSQSDVIDALARRCGEIRNELTLILESDSADQVYWYDVRGRGVFLWASPIRISPILSDRLFSKIDTAVLTSATLSTGGNFQFIRSRLGLQSCHELIVESPYDFSRQAILYVPRDLPEPKEKNWTDQACRELEKILEVSSGRAFLLFTSYAQMKAAHRNLQTRLPFPLLIQGEKTKNTLLEEFRKTPHAVLFATSSFWQGVDVQGEQLSCVVIDKLPFSVPSDPIVAARIRHLNEAGENAFYEYQIPEAIILLKQGMGRLIRGQSDRGILALLDKRIVTKSYGSTFINSLPSLRLTHDLAEIRNFLKNGNSV